MITTTHSPYVLLEYLESSMFPDVPAGLWDHRLWFYRDLLPVMNEPISGSGREGVTMYVAAGGSVPHGVAMARSDGDGATATARVAADNSDVARKLATRVIRDRQVQLVSVGLAGCQDPGEFGIGEADGGTVSYWTDGPSSQRATASGAVVRELEPDDVALFDSWVFPDGSNGWPEWPQYVANGIRYFGTIVDGRLVSTAGLCQTTKRATEIIAVGTNDTHNRQKGYASLCCSFALSEGLAQSSYCTWTCDRANVASRKTAETLGMVLAGDVVRIPCTISYATL